MKARARCYFTGIVQGVGFRYLIERFARELKLTGFVKNNPNGTVEAHFSGDIEAIKKIVSICRKGPSLGSVKKLDIKECKEEFSDFKIQ
ncbi:MAG: acylphosphatase [Candidatus Woesearchaeota archaeon]